MAKVTDICSTDPKDPTYCESPGDIKLERNKVKVMEKLVYTVKGPLPGNEYPNDTAWWYFVKCWDDGLAQPAYTGPGTNNWFTTPALPNNNAFMYSATLQQARNNAAAYEATYGVKNYYPSPNPAAGFLTKKRTDYESPPLPDWQEGDAVPKWCPIAGGKGWGQPTGDCGDGGNGTDTTGSDTIGSDTIGNGAPKVGGSANDGQNGGKGGGQGTTPATSAVAEEPTGNTSEPLATSKHVPAGSSTDEPTSTSNDEPTTTTGAAEVEDCPDETEEEEGQATPTPAIAVDATSAGGEGVEDDDDTCEPDDTE